MSIATAPAAAASRGPAARPKAAPVREVAAIELSADHVVLRGLARLFLDTPDPDRRCTIVRLAVDLFEVHSALEAQYYELPHPVGSWVALYDLIEKIEMTPPDSRLYRARTQELMTALDAYLALKQKQPAIILEAAVLGGELQRHRLHLLREASELLNGQGGELAETSAARRGEALVPFPIASRAQ